MDSGDRADLSRSWLFNPIDGKIITGSDMHTARCGSVLTVLTDGRVLITGGRSSWSGTPIRASEIYDPKTGFFTDLGAMCEARALHGVVQIDIDDAVLVSGETDGADPQGGERLTPSVEILDIRAKRHKMIGRLGIARTAPILALCKTEIIVDGGWGASGQNQEGWIRSWETFPLAN